MLSARKLFILAVLPLSAMLFSSFSWSQAGDIILGGAVLTPALDIELRQDDNITSSATDEIDSLITVVRPSVDLTVESGANNYGIFYSIENGSYANSSEDDYTDHTFSTAASLSLNRRNNVALFAKYALDHEERGSGFSKGLGDSITQPDEFTNTALNVSYNYGVGSARGGLEFRVGLDEKDYDTLFDAEGVDTTASRDRDDTMFGATYTWNVSGRTSVLAAVNSKMINYESGATLNSDESNVMLGVTWQGTGKTSGSIKIGRRDKDFEAASREDFDGARWEASVDFSPQSYSTFNFATSRDSAENSGAAGNFINATRYVLSWTHQWNQRLNSVVSYTLANNDYEGSSREDDSSYFNASLKYSWDRWINFRLAVSKNETDSNDDAFDFDRMAVSFGAYLTL